MIIPIRCFTCGKPIAHLYNEYLKMIEQKFYEGGSAEQKRFVDVNELLTEDEKTIECKALDKLGLHRYCCRRMMLGNIDLTDDI